MTQRSQMNPRNQARQKHGDGIKGVSRKSAGSARLGALEAVASGITTLADISTTDCAFQAAQEIGLRSVIYREVMTIHANHVDQAVEEGMSGIASMKERADLSRTQFGISPGPIYACHPKVFEAVSQFAQDSDLPLALHVGGSQEEFDFVRYGSSPFSIHASEAERIREHVKESGSFLPWLPAGTTPVRYVYNWGVFDAPQVLAIHCVHIDNDDLQILRESNVSIAYCPRIHAKLGMGMAPVLDFVANGITVGLGTDSPAAIDTTDMIDEMRFGLMINRAVNKNKNDVLPSAGVLRMATIDGARALHMERQVGSLEVGKRADIIAVDLHNSHQNPTTNPESAVIYTANQDNVMMTMVDGRVLYDNFKHVSGVDRNDIVEKAKTLRERLREDFANKDLREQVMNSADEEHRERFSR